MIKVRNIETGRVFDVIKVSGEYWIDETGYIESEQLGITWELIDDYKQLYEQQKQRADELENRWSDLKNTVNEFHQEAIFEESRSNDDGDRGIVYACEKILEKISDLEEENE